MNDESLGAITRRAFVELDGDLAASAGDFEALEELRRLAYSDHVDQPRQLDMWATVGQ